MIKRRIFTLLLAGLLLSSCTQYSFETSTKPNRLSSEIILQKINKARRVNGKGPLILSEKLTKAAQNQANIMAKTGILSHEIDGNLRQRVTKVGYRGAVGENLSGGHKTLEKAIEGWLSSPAHRSTLLSDKFSEFGLAYSFSNKGKYSTYWVFIAGGSFEPWL